MGSNPFPRVSMATPPTLGVPAALVPLLAGRGSAQDR
jgi:hypothetical protein